MAGELEPTDPNAIEPTVVYGPDDWRPYSDGIDHERAAACIVSDLERALDRFRAQSKGDYEPTDPEKEAAQRAVTNYTRTRGYALSMDLMDPKAAFRITGSGA